MPRTKIAADKLRNMQQSKTANDKLLSKQQTNIADEKLRSKQQQLARRREHYAANSAAILEQQRKRQRPIIRRCVVCGKEFDNRKGAKTCSPEHLKEYRRVCDHEYYLANQEKWVVSDRKRRAKRSPKIRQCVVCGKDFVVVSGKENTCSL